MKKLFSWAAAALLCIGFSSCSKTYFQLVNVQPEKPMTVTKNDIVFEDENCIISYNMWSKGGNLGMLFTNKTDKDIRVDLAYTFFYVNGIAYDYYTGATTSTANSIEVSNLYWGRFTTTGIGTKQTRQISQAQLRYIIIPAKLSKYIGEFEGPLMFNTFKDCNLPKAPSRRHIVSLPFTKEESPYVFGNRITYYVGKSEEEQKIDNCFYISKITNYPEKEFRHQETDCDKECAGRKYCVTYTVYPHEEPNAFYLKYISSEADKEAGTPTETKGKVKEKTKTSPINDFD